MGKKLRDEDLVLNIIVNGDKGKAELNKLGRAVVDMKSELTGLEAKRKKLSAVGKENTTAWQQNEQAIKNTTQAIALAEERMNKLRKGLNLTNMSIRDLQKEQSRLTALMKASTPGSENYKRYRAEIDRVRNRLRELGVEVESGGRSLGRMADKFNRYFGMMAAFAGSVSVGVMGLRKANQAYAEHDDKLADVMKTTGLAKDAVKELDAEFKQIDTRTAQLELLGLAQQAGKLGISAQKDVDEFVKAADKIGVALGEDLGGKEEAINTMGKLVDLFKIKDEYGMAEGMLKVGSAVNALGAASTANEGYIVDFASRTGGIAVASKVAASDIMALGATFDSLNAPAEASATVVNKVITGMFSKTSQYAKVAHMDVKAFTDLLRTDANEALLRVLDGFRGEDLGQTVAMLGMVGEDGARAAQAISLISSNIATVREQQALANDEFVKGTGVIDEFNTKNTTAQAELEKAQKKAHERLVELGEMIQPLMRGAVSGFSSLIKGLTFVVKYFIEYKAVIFAVTGALLALSVAQKIKNSWDKIELAAEKLKVFWNKAARVSLREKTAAMLEHTVATKAGTVTTASFTLAQKAMALVQSLVTLNFKAMATSAKAFFVSLGPIGWVITAITILGGAVGYFAGKSKEAFDAHKTLKDITDQASNSIAGERITLESYLRVATSKTASDKARNEAMQELQKLMPGGINLINEETIANGKAKKAVDDYCESLLVRAKLEAAKDKLVELEKQRLEAIQKGEDKELSFWQKTKAHWGGKIFPSIGLAWAKEYREANEKEFQTTYNEQEKFFKNIIDNQTESLSKISSLSSDAGESPVIDPPVFDDGKKPQQWSLDNDKEFAAARVELKRKLLAGEIASEEEYNSRLLSMEIDTLRKRIASKKDSGEQLSALTGQLLDKELTQAKESNRKQQEIELLALGEGAQAEKVRAAKERDDRKKATGLALKVESDMTETEKQALLAIERTYNKRLSAIRMGEIERQAKELRDEMERKLTTTRTEQNNELAAADTFEQRKVLLKKWYSDEEIATVKSKEDAEKLIRERYSADEQAATKKELAAIADLYAKVLKEIEQSGGLLDGTVEMSQEDVAKLNEILSKLGEDISKIRGGGKAELKDETDLLGMTAGDWATLFQNTEDGLSTIEKMEIAARALGNAFSEVSQLLSALDQRELKSYEKTQSEKRKALDRQLDRGMISREAHAARTEQLDEQIEAKRIEIETRQAERDKALAVFNAMISTAVAVASALKAGPVAGPIFAGIIGALGAVQVASILATPLPGREEGGWIDVEREQDGRRYRAQYDPSGRGWVTHPKVIVGEKPNSEEYVVDDIGAKNPTIRPVLDIIESARRSGSLRTLNLMDHIAPRQRMPGRESGGWVSSVPASAPPVAPGPEPDDRGASSEELLRILVKLSEQLDNPVAPEIVMSGTRGLARKLEKYNSIRDRSVIGRRTNP